MMYALALVGVAQASSLPGASLPSSSIMEGTPEADWAEEALDVL